MSGLSELASTTGIPPERLGEMLATVGERYRRFPLCTGPKKRRWIHAPEPGLKAVQRAILHGLLYGADPHPCAHGFVPGRSIVSNARAHVRREWVVGLDIRDFFPSTPAESVLAGLSAVPGLSPEAAKVVVGLTTLEGVLPQGAPTSPCAANLAVRGLDDQLAGLASARGLTYTRYADDLTFSGDERPADLVGSVASVLEEHGYRLAGRKTRVMGRHVRQEVTGLVVNDRVQPPRAFRRWLRAVLHDVRQSGIEAAIERAGLDGAERLAGHFAYLTMTAPDLAERELRAFDEKLG